VDANPACGPTGPLDGLCHRGIIFREFGIGPRSDRIQSWQRMPQQGQEMGLKLPIGLHRTVAFRTGHADATLVGDAQCQGLQVLYGHGSLRRIKVGLYEQPETKVC